MLLYWALLKGPSDFVDLFCSSTILILEFQSPPQRLFMKARRFVPFSFACNATGKCMEMFKIAVQTSSFQTAVQWNVLSDSGGLEIDSTIQDGGAAACRLGAVK